MKKIIALLLGIMMVFSCGVTAIAQENQDIAKITWYMNFSSYTYQLRGIAWDQDWASSILKEKFGLDIEIVVAANDTGEQLAAMIAANKIPDVISVNATWDNASNLLVRQLAEEGYLAAYDDLIQEYVPDQANVFRSDIMDWYRQSDGKTYNYPSSAYSQEDLAPGEHLVPNRCITVRKDLWEALGCPDMSTPAAFLDACERAMKELGTYDGKDIIGLQLYEQAGEAATILRQYFAVPYEDENGQFIYEWDAPGTKEVYAFLNEAYRRGIINESVFSDNREMIREKIASGRVFAMITAPQDFTAQMRTLYEADPNATYIAMYLGNAAGDEPVINDLRGWGSRATCISASSPYKDRIIKLIAYLLSDEGVISYTYGEEGVHFNFDETGHIVRTPMYEEAAANNDVKKFGLNALWLFSTYAVTRKYDPVLTQPIDIATNDILVKTPMAPYAYAPMDSFIPGDDPRVTAYQENNLQLTNYLTPAVAELITAESEQAFEGKYAEILETLPKVADMDLIRAYLNDGLQNAKQKLGIDYYWPPYRDAEK